MNHFKIYPNDYLTQEVQGFYHADFGGAGSPNNPNFLYKLKNDPHHNWSKDDLISAMKEFAKILEDDLPAIQAFLNNPLTICVVPRSKADINYRQNQLLFKNTIKKVVQKLEYIDGTDYIVRHTNTKTTHLRQPIEGYENDGDPPYEGITNATCNISRHVRDKDILLIDDIYTKTVDIDEDAIEALLDNGARSVAFYAIGRTYLKF